MSIVFPIRSLSPQESRVVLTLTEMEPGSGAGGYYPASGRSPESADHVIRSLRRKGWLQQASWGNFLLIPPDQGPEALGEGNLLALASRIAEPHPYYLGYGTAAAHYGLTTQHRNTIWLVTLARCATSAERFQSADCQSGAAMSPTPARPCSTYIRPTSCR